jgi:6-pyruvoyltetrahydropterin/6-carboxytetrahydropterin synthase
MIRLTRRYRFSASHRLHSQQLSEAQNRELYGQCNNPRGHGHDYLLEVGVRGPVDQRSGRVADVDALDGLVAGEVIRPFDHRNLNQDVAEFASTVPTAENLALEVERRLRARWSGVFPGEWPRLERIRIWETKRNAIELP